MMPETSLILTAAGFGLLGGAVRVLVTSLKASVLRKVSWKGLILYAIIVMFVGAFSGILLNFGKILSFLAGYAGLDLIEGYGKLFKSKKISLKK
jgi:ribose/xylose/arabinose/galactoside ABC-type transport system permease subunit